MRGAVDFLAVRQVVSREIDVKEKLKLVVIHEMHLKMDYHGLILNGFSLLQSTERGARLLPRLSKALERTLGVDFSDPMPAACSNSIVATPF